MNGCFQPANSDPRQMTGMPDLDRERGIFEGSAHEPSQAGQLSGEAARGILPVIGNRTQSLLRAPGHWLSVGDYPVPA
jgi:hypothetical protein